MRRHLGLVAFGTTLAVLVPATLHHLNAGPQQFARLFAPGRRAAAIGGVEVTAALDRSVAEAGEPVRLRLTAAQPVGVGIVVLATDADSHIRAPSPPISVAYQEVKLVRERSGDGAAAEVSLSLRRGNTAPLELYTVYVMSPAAAARLEQLRRRARPVISTGDGIPDTPEPNWVIHQLIQALDHHPDAGRIEGPDAALFAAGTVARLEVRVRRKNASVAIEAPETNRLAPFKVTVSVTNRTQRKIAGGTLVTDVLYVRDGELASDEPSARAVRDEVDLAPGETKRYEVQVAPSHGGLLGLHATVSCYKPCVGPRELERGAFEVIDIRAPLIR